MRPEQPALGHGRVEDGQSQFGDCGREKVGHVRLFEDEHGRLQGQVRAVDSQQDNASGNVVLPAELTKLRLLKSSVMQGQKRRN